MYAKLFFTCFKNIGVSNADHGIRTADILYWICRKNASFGESHTLVINFEKGKKPAEMVG